MRDLFWVEISEIPSKFLLNSIRIFVSVKILIIEDEKELASSIANYLEGQGYRCEFAEIFDQAVNKISSFQYDCVLLDLMLPGGSGLKVLEEIKKQNKQDGVIIISAKGSLEDKVTGLEMGADDYLAKPFHLSELSARIHSLLRRKQFGSSDILTMNELRIDVPAKMLSVKGETVSLTKKEFELLLLFIGNKNRVISKNALAEHLSGDMADMLDNHDFVYAHIKNLKRKLKEAGYNNYLKTVYGTGYKWEI